MFKSNLSNSRVKLMSNVIIDAMLNAFRHHSAKLTTKGLAVAMAALLLAMPSIGGPVAAAVAAVSSNFVFIVSSAQHFGDEPGAFGGTFRGDDFDFIFDAPGINPNRRALLILEARGVGAPNVFQINGVNIGGALQQRDTNETFTEMADVPAGTLRATGNVLRVIARNTNGQAGGNLDDFVIDNVVLHYIEQ